MAQLENLVETLELQKTQKRDFIAGSKMLSFEKGNLIISGTQAGAIEYTPTKVFHAQVAEKLSIPKTYYDKMKIKAISLLDDNVNHWLHKEEKSLLIRTFEAEDNIARAFLSNGYNIMDNYDILFAALDAIKATGLEVEIVNAELSENRMYLKVTCPSVEVEAKRMLQNYGRAAGVNYGVISGFVLENSEIGLGSFRIMPRGVVKVCMNGLVMAKDALKRVHLGAKMDELGFSKNEAVKAANLKLIKEQVKHAVKVFLSKQYLNKLVDVYTELGEKEIVAPVANVIEVVSKEYDITDARKMSILNHFIKGGDTRRIGIINAITEECQELKDADLRHDSEVICHEILTNFNKIEAAAFKTKFTTN